MSVTLEHHPRHLSSQYAHAVFSLFYSREHRAQGAFLEVKKRRLKFCSVRFETLLLAIKHATRELKMTRMQNMLSGGNIYEACLCEAGPVLGYGDPTQAKALPFGRRNVEDWTMNKLKDGL